MYCIVPLAGPDFFDSVYGFKPLFKVDEQPLIKMAISSRGWYKNKEIEDKDILFVLRDIKEALEVEIYLRDVFSGCHIVKVPYLTKGALLSALAGAALIHDFLSPIVVDLVDILYQSDFSPKKIFQDNVNIGGILPHFQSTHEKYSYLEIVDGYVIKTLEKQVISDHASAGTYFFRDITVFLEAVQDSIKFANEYSVKSNLFLCPGFNGVIKGNKKVLAVEVADVREIKDFSI